MDLGKLIQARLDRRKVDANDGRIGVLVTKVNGPDTGASAYIKDTLDL